MSDKSIKITEKDIMTRFDEMCQESLSPDVYSTWVNEIIPALNKIRAGLKEKKIGMYGDTPRVQIGKFTICEQSDPVGETVWIESDKDGGEFPKILLEKIIEEFYNKNL